MYGYAGWINKDMNMKKENILVLALICIALIIIVAHNQIKNGEAIETAVKKVSDRNQKSTGIQWKEYSQGLEQAKSQNRHVFLYFHAQWCAYCKKMEQSTFKDDSIASFLNKNFINIQIDTDKDKEISDQWKVRGLPTIWFLKPDGTRLDNLPGYVDSDFLGKVLTYIHSGKYETMSFNQFLNSLTKN